MLVLPFLLLPILVIISWLGYQTNHKLLRPSKRFRSPPSPGKVVIDLVVGFSTFFLATHILAFVLNSFVYACYVITGIVVTWFLIDIKNFRNYVEDIKGSNLNWLVIIYALSLGFIAAYKNFYVGDAAKFQFSLIGSIANNHVYPPIAPFDWAQNLSGYHFGVVATSTLFKILCGLDVFQASAIQLGMQLTFFVILIYSLFNLISKSPTWSMVFTLTLFHFYSILQGSLLIPWMFSRAHTLAFSWTLVAIIIFLCIEKKNFKNYFFVLSPLSFFLYFAIPAAWYPLVAGAITCLMIQTVLTRNWSQERLLFVAVTAVSLGIGKLLTLMKSFTSLNGVEALIFKPGLRWFAMLNTETQSYKPHITSIQLDKMATIPLWSWYSFKSFLLLFTIATIIFLIDAFKYKQFEKSILYFSASASMLIPFLYVFEPYPKDTQRFIFYSQIIFLVYILLFLSEHLGFKIPKMVPPILSTLSFVVFAHGVIFKPDQFRTYAIPQSQKEFIQELEQIHKSGDVMVDTEFLHINSFYPNIAGFYSVGGHFYSADTSSKITAIYTLNPVLLQELNVDYILITRKYKAFTNKVVRTVISPPNELSSQALERIKDSRLFEIINLKASPSSLLLKFKARNHIFSDPEIEKYQQEYFWTVGERNIYRFTPIPGKDGNLIQAKSRAQLTPLYRKIQKKIAQDNIPGAVSLSMAAKGRAPKGL